MIVIGKGVINKKEVDLVTAETRTKEPVFISILRLKLYGLNPLNKNPKQAEIWMVLL